MMTSVMAMRTSISSARDQFVAIIYKGGERDASGHTLHEDR
jgi:hypothetical protein